MTGSFTPDLNVLDRGYLVLGREESTGLARVVITLSPMDKTLVGSLMREHGSDLLPGKSYTVTSLMSVMSFTVRALTQA